MTWIVETWNVFRTLPGETQGFIAGIAAFWLFFQIRFTAKTAAHAPTLLTIAGILGTFLGIALGLQNFDTTDVQASIPELLAGLKTAFWVSFAGILAALTLKFRDYVFGPWPSGGDATPDEDVTAADLANLLKDIRAALGGSEPNGLLIDHIKRARQENNDRLDALREEQTKALAKLSEMGSKALIEALRDVIRDFNGTLNEQFGENFKELNLAVGRLLVWQEQYKATLETTVSRLDDVTRISAQTASDYAALVDNTMTFSKSATNLGKMIATLEADRVQLHTVSEALAKLLRDSAGSLPAVEAKVVALTRQLSSAVEENQKVVGKALTENSTAIRAAVETAGKEITTANAACNKQIADLVGKTREQVTVLDAALTEQLTKSLTSLGGQLSALSEKFVSDYTPLTKKLKDVLQLAG